MDVLLDSNILIYAGEPSSTKLREWVGMQSIFISQISELGVLGYHKISASEKKALSKIIGVGYSINVDKKVIKRAIILRQQKAMSLADSIIAATSLLQNLQLATANTKDFQHIKDLNLINPLDL